MTPLSMSSIVVKNVCVRILLNDSTYIEFKSMSIELENKLFVKTSIDAYQVRNIGKKTRILFS
jgi:hypothetical protein